MHERLVHFAHAAFETSRQRMHRMQIKNSEADMDGLAVSPPLAVRNGGAPSHVWVPAGPWNSMSEFLTARFPAISSAVWAARMARCEVVDERGTALPPDR